ncbi:hypothetical protein MOO45_07285 [Bombilactobacillus folatiphilus]|uniref:Uncharacterized protein n=1 Tax=Bombilactobacillus folatiphilus TaxID=2923362 RepID=A0ABY4P8X2_9LACO|nr:hypothetical protein [Bombilactobacillus folatiphilus]UQS81984.1 hypothetical protein MOO45_07285 [Bombilactobacillus folatiphilus]
MSASDDNSQATANIPQDQRYLHALAVDNDNNLSTTNTVDLYTAGPLGGTVWQDDNQDGTLEATESKMANVPVTLLTTDASGSKKVLTTATTDA